MKKSSYVVPALLAFGIWASSPLAADPPTVDFYLNSAGSGANLAGVYTSPYTGSINGGPTIPVICDDFADDSYVPEDWTAYVTSLSNILAGTADTSVLRWNASADGTLSQQQAYSAAALLAISLLQSATGSPSQKEYSFALWDLFDSAAFTSLISGGFTTEEGVAQGYLNTAENEALTGVINGGSLSSYLSNYNVTIYSYDAAGGPPTGCGGHCPPPPQEFITVTTPEASTPVLLAADLFGFLALFAFLRKRLSRAF